MKQTIFLLSLLLLWRCGDSPVSEQMEEKTPEVVIPETKFGLDLDRFSIVERKIKSGDTFGKILEGLNIDYPQVYNILEALKGTEVSVRKLTLGKPYSVFYTKDSLQRPEYFVYHPSIASYTLIHLQDSLYGAKISKPVQIRELSASGVIESSLY